MAQLDRLPTARDGPGGILKLAELFGDQAVFEFIGYIRNHRHDTPEVGIARNMLAVRMVRQAMNDNPALDIEAAKREIAKKLGYTNTTRTNFYKMVGAGQDGAPGRKLPART